MSKPHRELNDGTPLEAARTELGARRVEELLEKLFYGLPSNDACLSHRGRPASHL